ncbi:alditol oxidase [Angustibacter peucedani]
MAERNWAGNVEYGGPLERPESVEQLQQLVRDARQLRVVGSRHSFNDVVSTDGTLVTLDALPLEVEVDVDARQVVASGAVRFGELAGRLDAAGLALPNLGSLPHISVAGACATGTHGSGDVNQVLAASVAAVEVVRPDGELEVLRRGEPDFPGAVVSLGAVGPVVRVTLDAVPTFAVRQDVYDDVRLAPSDLLEALGSAYSVSLFSDLRSDRFLMAWRKQRFDPRAEAPAAEPVWAGGRLATAARHPVPGQPTEGTTAQGEVGPWHERLPHFRREVPPSSRGDELQSEYLLPREHAAAAWSALLGLRDELAPLVQIAEVRSVAADPLWISPASERDSVALHVTWVQDEVAVRAALERLEPLLVPFAARPHWGKVSVLPAERLPDLYPHLGTWAEMVRRRDPQGVFRNAFVERVVGSV